MARERSPGMKLLFAVLIGAALIVPLIFVYALVSDRQSQSHVAQNAITAGWGGQQVISGPLVVIPYEAERVETEAVNGRSVSRTVKVREELYLAPLVQKVKTELAPEMRRKSIYSSVIYTSRLSGTASFALPEDLAKHGVRRDQLLLDQAELRFGVSDPRGLQSDASVTLDGTVLPLQPGKGVAASGNSGFYGFFDWSSAAPVEVSWQYGLRGSHSFTLVPRGGNTQWQVSSPWPHPGFSGSFLPEDKKISDQGFTASYAVPNLALGQALVMLQDPGPPLVTDPGIEMTYGPDRMGNGSSMAATIGLVEPVDLYSRVDRSVKYGFLFIGFTFLAFLMFDIVGGARVAAAEYLMTGAGLVLFFVLLLAFAEVIGFALAYALASLAIIGLLTAYSAAVLASWLRARFIGALLLGLYALLYVLLNLEAWSLLIGSVLLFAALAGVMYATRRVDWSAVGRNGDGTEG
ncbi:colicin resistance protein [Croceicoccus estronivorus]|uniref:cell envelope integrity protein CreD n=1 Tax=Croceicoccus estronivorus TaxID=1172626 RepID=UPI000829CC28|nr:cell envelope integrity protein CreD [Croceicoccus estronivorus]OCC23121.1 colicin resistance protein [Croceicoccus estronivorus]